MSDQAPHSGHRPSRWTKAAGRGARAPSPAAWIVIGIGVVVVLLVVFLVGLPLATVATPKGTEIAERLEDLTDVRIMLDALHAGPLGEETPLASDGKLNIYRVLRREGMSDADIVKLCRSSRSGTGPTADEVKGGDYANFPYERHAGPVDIETERALLWDPEPGEDGARLVGITGASARFVEAAEFARLTGD